jgi:hypothetical protein
MALTFQATGGTGMYTFTVTQTILTSGESNYGAGGIYTFPGTVTQDRLLDSESQQDGSTFTFSDTPGVWSYWNNSALVGTNFIGTLDTTVTVTSGDGMGGIQQVSCPEIIWTASVMGKTDRKGILHIKGRAKVKKVIKK